MLKVHINKKDKVIGFILLFMNFDGRLNFFLINNFLKLSLTKIKLQQ